MTSAAEAAGVVNGPPPGPVASRQPTGEAGWCPRCGGPRVEHRYAFPPALAARFGQEGIWSEPECENANCERLGRAVEDLDRWEQARTEAKRQELFARSELPARIGRMSLSDFDPGVHPSAATAVGKVLAYAHDFEAFRPGASEDAGRGLFLVGPVGTGKTHLAAALAQKLMDRGVPVLFVTVPELLDGMRPGGDAAGSTAVLDRAKGADLLILDDLGAEKPTEWARERLFVLINHRTSAELPTVYTSNVGPEMLGNQLGARSASRIVETCKFVALEGPDYRDLARRRRRRKENEA